jgi:hypothetical protein
MYYLYFGFLKAMFRLTKDFQIFKVNQYLVVASDNDEILVDRTFPPSVIS